MAMTETQNAAPVSINEKAGDTVVTKEETDNAVDSEAQPVAKVAASTWRRRAIMASLCLTQFITALDVTIIATALPTITRALAANASEYAWIGSSFTLASTTSSPIWAKLSDLFGVKWTLVAANVMFFVGSLVAALSKSPEMLIGGRTIQGLASGGIQVLITILIGRMFAMQDRAKYYGLMGLVFAAASGLGPVLGGVFTQTIGWRWCFWINLPINAAALAVLVLTLEADIPTALLLDSLRALDWTGVVLIIGGTVAFLFGLQTGAGAESDWASAQAIAPLVLGVAAFGVFIWYESKFAKEPLIPMHIFCSLGPAAVMIITCLHSFIFIACDFFLPLYYQIVLQFSPLKAGLALLALVVPLSFATFLTGMLVRKNGRFSLFMITGSTMMLIGVSLFTTFGTRTEWAKIICLQIVLGVGVGQVFQTPLLALQSFVSPANLTAAISAQGFARNLFSSVSIVVGTVLLESRIGSSLDAADRTTAEMSVYSGAFWRMWIFYTAVCAAMLLTGIVMVLPKLKRDRERGLPTSTTSDQAQSR